MRLVANAKTVRSIARDFPSWEALVHAEYRVIVHHGKQRLSAYRKNRRGRDTAMHKIDPRSIPLV